eukprot:TRINITY_DN3524_c1_g1_i1.p1 TRINITY_DN3524_c1_g1~~TRINITY_DN3524_c1_g1_i1.p1  ORF type:complete len:145 (+),score=12.82 TRINITY_DN3524_c1_g1_i1:735-1169(+)
MLDLEFYSLQAFGCFEKLPGEVPKAIISFLFAVKKPRTVVTARWKVQNVPIQEGDLRITFDQKDAWLHFRRDFWKHPGVSWLKFNSNIHRKCPGKNSTCSSGWKTDLLKIKLSSGNSSLVLLDKAIASLIQCALQIVFFKLHQK